MNARISTRCGVVIAMLVLLIDQTASADEGRMSRATLDEMGLGGLTVISDDEAESIRGLGFKGSGKSTAVAYGNSWARVNVGSASAQSENGYFAKGKHFAAGANLSFAGATVISSKGKHSSPWGKSRHGGKFGGNHGGKFDGKNGGKNGGHTKVTRIKVFAGGFSVAVAR